MAVKGLDAFSVRKRQIEFVEYLSVGFTPRQAIQKIGYNTTSKSNIENAVNTMMKSPFVVEELAKLHEENRKEMAITREKVQSIVLEAIDMGRIISDPMAIIRGAQELNKMCGFYAPEEKKITLTAEQRRLTAKYDEISDADLVALVNQRDASGAIDAEFEDITTEDGQRLPPVKTKFADKEIYDANEG